MKTGLENMTGQNKVLITLLCAIVFCYCFYTFVYEPQTIALEQVQTEVIKQQEYLTSVKKVIKLNPNLDIYLSNTVTKANTVDRLVPNQMEMSSLLVNLDKEALASGITLTGIRPSKTEDKKQYQEILLEVTVRGSFVGITNFINRLENLNRLNKIQGLAISSNDAVLDATIKTSVFVYGDAAAVHKVVLPSDVNSKPVNKLPNNT